jgi:predicted dehydrogenase
MIRLARELIEAGEIGEIVSFRGRHAENYMADPDVPHSFRTNPDGGGALSALPNANEQHLRCMLWNTK